MKILHTIAVCTAALCAALWVVVPGQAEAQNVPQLEPKNSVSMIVSGGMLSPMGDMAQDYQQVLSAGGHISWIGSSGLGMDLAVEYSPLLRWNNNSGMQFETHFVTASIMPRYTLGRKLVRFWLGAGGGLAYQRQNEIFNDTVQDTQDTYAPVGMGAAGLEVHVLGGVGLVVMGSYTRAFQELPQYEFFSVKGGLVLSFR